MTVIRERHLRSGKLYGMFYTFASGKKMYLAFRSGSGKSTKGFYVRKNGWCIDETTLRECEHRGCEAVGVCWRVGGKYHYYLTNLKDFWNPPSEKHFGDAPQRLLNRDRFLVYKVATKKGLISGVASAISLGR